MLELVRRYTQIFGPSGREDQVITAFLEDMQQLGLEASVDPLGNVTVPLKPPEAHHPHILITAHLDEIGLVIRNITDDGFVQVHRIGGVHDRVVPGLRLVFQNDRNELVEAVAGVKSKHLSNSGDLNGNQSLDDLYFDLLVSSAEQVHQLGLHVGSIGAYSPSFSHHGDLVCSKALDNRAGMALLVQVARQLHAQDFPAGVTLLATVQEEFSVRGGVPAAARIPADFAICLDIALATDTPDLHGQGNIRVGQGAVLSGFSRASMAGIIPNPRLLAYARQVAEEQALPFSYGVMQGGLSDGSFMQYAGAGIPFIDVGFATRYTHTPVEVCSLTDLGVIARLVEAVVRRVPRDFNLSRGLPVRPQP